ncbi:hypothetical protein MHI39_08230 [Heyndrickxia sp. FSL K6-6286]|uniref:hypothetical protein n=1 Tax=Heyndrickxia sp. FSL K6-6286 TaxID=2921510 RepID=UPI00315A1EE7
MEKTITIDGRDVRFKSTAATPLRYKAQFHKDFFTEVLKLAQLEKLKDIEKKKNIKIEDFEGLDFEVFYNIAWTMAKTADKDIPDPMSWLDEFDEFPMIEIVPELFGMAIASLQSKKKQMESKMKVVK